MILLEFLCCYPIPCSSLISQVTALCHLSQVGICIDNDARKMMNDYGVCVQPLMDLSILANIKLAGPPKRWSLASLTQMITCKEVF
jgi:hypothetical protein